MGSVAAAWRARAISGASAGLRGEFPDYENATLDLGADDSA